MAKKAKLNKSDIIRKALTENAGMGPSALSKHLAEQHPGETFSPGLISLLKSKSKQKRGRPKTKQTERAGVQAKPQRAAANGAPLLEQLRQLKAQIGVEGLRLLVESL